MDLVVLDLVQMVDQEQQMQFLVPQLHTLVVEVALLVVVLEVEVQVAVEMEVHLQEVVLKLEQLIQGSGS